MCQGLDASCLPLCQHFCPRLILRGRTSIAHRPVPLGPGGMVKGAYIHQPCRWNGGRRLSVGEMVGRSIVVLQSAMCNET
jgi:hypothetical protein